VEASGEVQNRVACPLTMSSDEPQMWSGFCGEEEICASLFINLAVPAKYGYCVVTITEQTHRVPIRTLKHCDHGFESLSM
jgi:hypothetical protein